MKPVRSTPAPQLQQHSHSAGLLQEHDEEPVPGLPEELPHGERILWQGAPQWRVLAREAFHLHKLVLYFGLIGLLRLVFLLEDELTGLELVKGMVPFLVLAGSGLLIVWALAWLSARHTLYTLTNRRVVMRVGIVLTVTFNIPYTRITSANLRPGEDGHGDVTLEIEPQSRIPYLQLWPHARAWHLKSPQPTLRGIQDALHVATILTASWSQARSLRARPSEQQGETADRHRMATPVNQS
ncbi:MAG: PH domain-containing protein [Betaproteobacteria bacterium]|nr:PH domain-containing protein [Betaproteobacteria bacterium]